MLPLVSIFSWSKNFQLSDNHQQFYALCMALLSVGLFYLAFPSGGYGDVAWVTMVPILLSLNYCSERNAFALGVLAATLGWLCSIWWSVEGITKITSAPTNVAFFIVFLFCLIASLPYALACWLHVKYRLGYSILGAIKSAIIFTVLVNFIPHILPGNLAHALYQRPLFIQLADIGGVAIVFFIVQCVNTFIANGIHLVPVKRLQGFLCLFAACVLFLANTGYGFYRFHSYSSAQDSESKTLSFAMIQPNLSTEHRSRDAWLLQQNKLIELFTMLDQKKEVDAVIFPEVSVPLSYQYFMKDKIFFDQNLSNKTLLLTTIKPIKNELNESPRYFNTMELVADNAIQKQYSKQVLLPFGEYLPFEQHFPWIRKAFPNAANYRAGSDIALFEIKTKENTIKVVPLICYEAVFSDVVGKGVEAGGEVLVNSSNDAWFDGTAGKPIHLSLSLFRSIEYRQYLIRSTNSGISGVINPVGELLDSSIIEDEKFGYSINELNIKQTDTFYQKYPNVLKVVFLLLAFWSILIGSKAKQRNSNETSY